MNSEARQQLISSLDDELLIGGVVLSEWCARIVQETDKAFLSGADLATIITAVAAAETYFRAEFGGDQKYNLHELVERSSLDHRLRVDLQNLRRYRNKWVHVAEPWNDDSFVKGFQECDLELEKMAICAMHALRRLIYSNQFV
jgi:hypothetical protein